MKRVLIIGGSGFIGSHLVTLLLSQGHRVRTLQRSPSAALGRNARELGLDIRHGDFGDPVTIEAALEGQDCVFHLANTTLPSSSNDDPRYDVSSNVVGTIALLEAAVKQRIRHFIFISSGGTIYGRPRSVPIGEDHPTEPLCSYGISKLAIEKYLGLFLHLNNLNYSILRLANPYGRGQSIKNGQGAIAVFVDRAVRSLPIEIWGDGSVVRDFIHISDAVAAMVACMDYQGPDRVFNIGSGGGTSLNEIISAIETVLEQKLNLKYAPSRALDVAVNVLDISIARRELDWAPRVGLIDGIREMTEPRLTERAMAHLGKAN